MYQRQVVPTRQSQAQAVLRTRSQVPNVYRFFARPQGADQPLAVPPVLSRQNDNEQQAAINAAVQRQLESSLVCPPLHAHKLAAPRLQPLDTPTPCIITASVQDSVSLSPQSKDCCADAANSYFTVSSRLPSSPRQDVQDVSLPTLFEESDAAAAVGASAFNYLGPPLPQCQAIQSVQPLHEEPDTMTSFAAPAALDAHIVLTPNEKPNPMAATSPPPSHPEAPCVHQPIPHAKPDAVAAILSPAPLDAHIVPTPSKEPNAVTNLIIEIAQFHPPVITPTPPPCVKANFSCCVPITPPCH